jgi:hypothetical protein
VLLLHWQQLSCTTAVSLSIVIALPSRRPLRRHHCPLPLLPSIAIMPPPSIMIAAALHLMLSLTAPLLHWQRLSTVYCAVHCATPVPSLIVIALLSRCPVCRHCCPLPLFQSTTILPLPCIMIAIAVHLCRLPLCLFCIGGHHQPPIVPSIVPLLSHRPS